jgi:hypothetical protein
VSDRKDSTLLAEAKRLYETEHLSWTKIAQRLAAPERAQALRSWLYQHLQRNEKIHPLASPALRDHLGKHPAHALGRASNGDVCSDCQRLGLMPAICFVCHRMGFENLGRHLLLQHPDCADDVYREKYGYNRTTALVSARWHQRRSEETAGHMKSMRVRRKLVRPPAQKGRRWKNRTEALRNAVSRRAVEGRRTPRNVLAQFQPKHRISPWAVVKPRLRGETTVHIASHLNVRNEAIGKHSPLHQKVESMCRSLGMGGAPTRYWRGQRITNRHLRDVRADFRIQAKDLAAAMNVSENHLATALSGHERPLSLDLADRFLSARKRYAEERQSAAPTTSKGGHVPLLCPSEKKVISWQRKVLLKEIQNLGEDIREIRSLKSLTEAELGELLCRLKRKRKIETLFFWALDFLPWFSGKYGSNSQDLRRELVGQPAQIAREFLAAQYGQSENTIYLQRRESRDLTIKTRTLLLDIRQIFYGKDAVPTSAILAELRKHRPSWKRLSPKGLARMLGGAGASPQNLKIGARVLKGYQISALPLYSTAEAARKLGLHAETLQLLARTRKITAPPLLRRVRLRAGGRVRFWTDSDIRQAASAIAENQSRARTAAATFPLKST